MPWRKCNVCGTMNLIPRKIKKGKKASVRCSNPNCGAHAPLRIRNGHVRGLRQAFA